MYSYKAPIRDMQFVLHDLLQVEKHYAAIPAYADTNRELVDSILEASADFSENEIAPLNRSGDEEGCHFEDGKVTTPRGFKEAYAKFVELGFGSLAAPVEYGGQGLPHSLAIATGEMNGTANWSWSMYFGLSQGAVNTVDAHGTPEQKQTYLTKLVTGEWTGTMCLTESHAGSDLGLIRTKATPNADGSYSISGTKIFISAGEHDMADNIVHIVLARLPDAPAGTKGISLFIVPKVNVNADGSLGDRNSVACGSIEHKMGIKASVTCVMNFDGARGFLIGPPNRGLNCMFTFMNTARVDTALQGVCSAEGSFQGALSYARERLAMRALSGAKMPEREADPIIVHPAVRSMLLTQKAFAEGGRALVYWLATQIDLFHGAETEEQRKAADDLMSILTPIAKAFLTEMGSEAAKHGVQIYGGHGFIREWGMEQIVRDTRISCLYEGTTEIQALDLLGRKVLQSQGELLKIFTKIIHKFCQAHEGNRFMSEFTDPLKQLNQQWIDLTMKVGVDAMMNPDEVGGAAVDYMYFSGYATMAYLWAWMASVAKQKLETGTSEEAFYTAKIQTAQFYFKRILPRSQSHVEIINGGLTVIEQMDADAFAF
ncbi:acyl-CoA dehydrogenase C-terminal domain-containing protein [Pseudomonas sp. C11]|uniref:acyl-CoA dehydrogenase C-terminal domain-containing protein n=1 Tax=Pseudomonas sp. C11 TaxID=3075550 RepID=UPI002AFEC3A7|nr:acyl-CoA dehydrogenase C-terminal domain-containing protein [Pseudomonas sp. C11]